MGICWALLRPNGDSCLQVVKIDGKILEFRAPVVVKDVLVKFPAGSGIGLSKTIPQQQLPLNYELKMGRFITLYLHQLMMILLELHGRMKVIHPRLIRNKSVVLRG